MAPLPGFGGSSSRVDVGRRPACSSPAVAGTPSSCAGTRLTRKNSNDCSLRVGDSTPARASTKLADALALWRGLALAGTEEPFARDAAARWDELGLECMERLPLLSAGALLHAGQPDFDAYTSLAVEQLTPARTAGAPAWEGDALAMLATVAWARGEFEQALPLDNGLRAHPRRPRIARAPPR